MRTLIDQPGPPAPGRRCRACARGLGVVVEARQRPGRRRDRLVGAARVGLHHRRGVRRGEAGGERRGRTARRARACGRAPKVEATAAMAASGATSPTTVISSAPERSAGPIIACRSAGVVAASCAASGISSNRDVAGMQQGREVALLDAAGRRVDLGQGGGQPRLLA